LAPRAAILADAGVKHGQPLAAVTLEEQVQDVVERGLADGVLVTGPRTGAPASAEEVRVAALAAGDVPVYVASGVNKGNAARYLDAGARGFIVGTALKRGGRTDGPVDAARTREFVKVVTAWRGLGRRS
jgi:predicted TIM-barrel enzyme